MITVFAAKRREILREISSFSRCFFEKMACGAFIELSCYEDIHYILIEFKFQLDRTFDCGVSCPQAFLKSLLNYNGCQVSDRCPLGYLFIFCCTHFVEFQNTMNLFRMNG